MMEYLKDCENITDILAVREEILKHYKNNIAIIEKELADPSLDMNVKMIKFNALQGIRYAVEETKYQFDKMIENFYNAKTDDISKTNL